MRAFLGVEPSYFPNDYYIVSMLDCFVGSFWWPMTKDESVLDDWVVDELFYFWEYLIQNLESLFMVLFLFLCHDFNGENAQA